MIVSKKFIPSLFTILNAICGFMSVISSSHGEYEQAIYFICYAAIFDVFDGMVARILHTSSDFGVELDSLSDVVSFGFAPSFLLYSFFFKDYNAIGILVSSLVLAFGAIRLARFNISLTGYTKDVFYGIPVPMAALIICSYVLFYHDKVFTPQLSEKFIFGLTIFVSLMMVSKFRYPAMPSFNLRTVKERPLIFIGLLTAAVVSILTKGLAVFPITVLYIFYGVVNTFIPVKEKKKIRH
ncbi:MAG: CDP-diacylglycerol--serine O-phosphatidyltransferase [Ignavibacteria bacterium]|nr:CDP-diacylglycerol--serine O-phosphatidyltransferase [Ignavibacteria bacterium]